MCCAVDAAHGVPGNRPPQELRLRMVAATRSEKQSGPEAQKTTNAKRQARRISRPLRGSRTGPRAATATKNCTGDRLFEELVRRVSSEFLISNKESRMSKS